MDSQHIATQYQTEIGQDGGRPEKTEHQIDILMESMGQVNYGHKLADTQQKGVRTGVCRTCTSPAGIIHCRWTIQKRSTFQKGGRKSNQLSLRHKMKAARYLPGSVRLQGRRLCQCQHGRLRMWTTLSALYPAQPARRRRHILRQKGSSETIRVNQYI